jgi:AraC-like DNA-binding protein
MKIMHEHIDFPGQSTLKIKWGDVPFFNYPWHYHTEYEVLYLLESKGTRYVADSIEPFAPGDLVMVAGNLPHYWRNDDAYYKGNPDLHAKRIVVQFPNDFMKPHLETYPEFLPIHNLLHRSEKGIRFLPPHSDEIGNMLLELLDLQGFYQIIRFCEILHYMAHITNYKLLASDAYQPGKHDISDNRLDKVIRYLTFNYQNHITLDEVADVAGMHPTAFCRYFKEKTGKHLSAYLNELRIGFACKLLMKGNMQVSQVCYETGFNNLSNFNRTFKNISGFTPSQYRVNYLKGNTGTVVNLK